jgi:PAS domain-containing protein
VYDGTGLPVLMKGTVQDITERRMNEKAVKAERQRLYDVLETLPVYVVLLTPEYHVPFTNRFFRERFGESHGRRSFEYLFVSLRQERRSQLNGFPWALFLRIFIYSMGSKLLRIVDMGHECILKEARSTLAHSCGRM